MSFSAAPTESFDVIVVGGGHAGCEAAITAARLGLNTALFSLNLDRIAWQPCNPAVGGPAKSQLVHEVDALGGVIGRLADATAIQKRILNASRGPAVWALRAQTDKRLYSRQMLQLLQHLAGIEALVGLGAQGPHRRAAAGVEDALLDGGGISQAPDHATEGIHFMDELAFGGAADGRVAGLPGDSIEIEAEQGGVQAQPGGGDGRFTTGMASADHDHVEGFGGGGAEAHASII